MQRRSELLFLSTDLRRKGLLFYLWSFLHVQLGLYLIHDSRLVHLLNWNVLNILSLIRLVLLLLWPLTCKGLLPELWRLCYLYLLRRIYNLLGTIWLLLYILYWLDVLLLYLLLRLDNIDQLLSSILVDRDLLARWQAQNLLKLLTLVYWHLSSLKLCSCRLECFRMAMQSLLVYLLKLCLILILNLSLNEFLLQGCWRSCFELLFHTCILIVSKA